MRFIDLFGGVGGFRLGIENATNGKWKCVWYCDNDKYAVQVYNKNFNENWKPTDIRTVKPEDIPDFDMLCAGFPCQAFSIAGKRRGFEDTRGTLFFEIARILKAKRPKIVFLENVKGLLNHKKGQTFRVILQTLDELGYDIQWMVLNSKFFGVPQNRERVFIIGNLRGTSRPEILPFRESDKINNVKSEEFSEQVSNTLRTNYSKGYSNETYILGQPIVHPAITEAIGRQGSSKEFIRSCEKILEVNQAQSIYSTEGTSITLKGCGGGQGAKTGLYAIHSLYPRAGNPKEGGTGHLVKEPNDTYCLDTGNMQALEFNNMKIRRLTPKECERLQGFPDDWTKYGINEKGELVEISDTQRYKQMGNAVTVNVIEAIARKLLKLGG